MTEIAVAFPQPQPPPSQAFHEFFRNWGGLLSLLSVVVATIVLGIYIGRLKSRLESVEKHLDLNFREMTELRQSVENLRTSLEGRINAREVSIEGMDSFLARMVAIEANLSSLSKDIGNTKQAVSESVKEMKSETGKMRTDMQKIVVQRTNESNKIIKEASGKNPRRPDEQKRQQKR
jgi:hypothetical protein